MKQDNQQFFQAAFEENRNKWLCADSWLQDSSDPEKRLRPTASYIIQIVSTKGSAATVDIGDSYTNRTADNFGQDGNITITSTIQGVTYREFLAQSEEEPFMVGRTMVISTSSGQLENPVLITHRNANGDADQHAIMALIDPYQKLTDRVIDDKEYLFDGMSRLRFRINASATVAIKLYLVNKWAASQEIANRSALVQYQPPRIVKAAPIALNH